MQSHDEAKTHSVSQRFLNQQDADQAVTRLADSGVNRQNIKIWTQRSPMSDDDLIGRSAEGFLAGGFVCGVLSVFLVTAYTWGSSSNIAMELTVGVALISTIIGALITASMVNLTSKHFGFTHGSHNLETTPGIVVSVSCSHDEDKRMAHIISR